jgi:hypothetical protein
VQTIKTSGLPAMRVLWLSESALATAGHNMNPDVYARSGAGWKFIAACDVRGSPAAGGPRASKSFDTAKALFNAKVSKGVTGAEAEEISSSIWTKHQGAITCIHAVRSSGKRLLIPAQLRAFLRS